ncbi:MAG: hypothetical protein JXR83_15790, partial [Deltaproteobacteria bacterium]|nr:hypothetical protein [Deltaproteobacteria bacterium]
LPRELLKPFLADWGSVERLFDDVATRGRVVDPALRRLFGAYRIYDANGRLTVPVIDEQRGDRSYQLAAVIAERVAAAALTALELEHWQKELGLRDRQQALVICYHELMWELLLRYEQLGVIVRPVAFAAPERAQPADIGDLILMVRHAAPVTVGR